MLQEGCTVENFEATWPEKKNAVCNTNRFSRTVPRFPKEGRQYNYLTRCRRLFYQRACYVAIKAAERYRDEAETPKAERNSRLERRQTKEANMLYGFPMLASATLRYNDTQHTHDCRATMALLAPPCRATPPNQSAFSPSCWIE